MFGEGKMSWSIRIPKINIVLLAYYFTSPIWRTLFWNHVPGGWMLNPIIIMGLLFLTILDQKKFWNEYFDIIIFYIFIDILCLL